MILIGKKSAFPMWIVRRHVDFEIIASHACDCIEAVCAEAEGP